MPAAVYAAGVAAHCGSDEHFPSDIFSSRGRREGLMIRVRETGDVHRRISTGGNSLSINSRVQTQQAGTRVAPVYRVRRKPHVSWFDGGAGQTWSDAEKGLVTPMSLQ